MLIDLLLELNTAALPKDEFSLHSFGHIGMHFDVMNKEFPLGSFKTSAAVVDISHVRDREVQIEDIPESARAPHRPRSEAHRC